jgi:hypothetical protein
MLVTWCWLSHSLTHGAEPFLRSCQLCSHSRTFQWFMEPEGPLPRSQEPSTIPYPAPNRSNPILSKIYFNIVHPLTWLSHFCYEMIEVRKYIVTGIKHFVNMVQALNILNTLFYLNLFKLIFR